MQKYIDKIHIILNIIDNKLKYRYIKSNLDISFIVRCSHHLLRSNICNSALLQCKKITDNIKI